MLDSDLAWAGEYIPISPSCTPSPHFKLSRSRDFWTLSISVHAPPVSTGRPPSPVPLLCLPFSLLSNEPLERTRPDPPRPSSEVPQRVHLPGPIFSIGFFSLQPIGFEDSSSVGPFTFTLQVKVKKHSLFLGPWGSDFPLLRSSAFHSEKIGFIHSSLLS